MSETSTNQKKNDLSKYVEIIASRQVLRSLKVQSAPLFSRSGRSSLWLPEMSRKSIHQPESMVGDDCIQFPIYGVTWLFQSFNVTGA